MKRPNKSGPGGARRLEDLRSRGILRTLAEDNAAVRVMLQQVEESADGGPAGPWRRLFPMLRAELIAYSRARQEVLHPHLRKITELEPRADERLQEIERLVQELRVADPDDPVWGGLFRELAATVREHLRFEEHSLFERIGEHIDSEESEALDGTFRQRRAEVREQHSMI